MILNKILRIRREEADCLLLQPIAERLYVDDGLHRSLDGASMVRYNNRLVSFAAFHSVRIKQSNKTK